MYDGSRRLGGGVVVVQPGATMGWRSSTTRRAEKKSARAGSSHEVCEGRGSQPGRGNGGPAPRKRPVVSEGWKSKPCAKPGPNPPDRLQGGLRLHRPEGRFRGIVASRSLVKAARIPSAGGRQSASSGAAIWRPDRRIAAPFWLSRGDGARARAGAVGVVPYRGAFPPALGCATHSRRDRSESSRDRAGKSIDPQRSPARHLL